MHMTMQELWICHRSLLNFGHRYMAAIKTTGPAHLAYITYEDVYALEGPECPCSKRSWDAGPCIPGLRRYVCCVVDWV